MFDIDRDDLIEQLDRYSLDNFFECESLLMRHYNNNADRVILWFITRNPNLGSVSPMDMLKANRGDMLLKFIKLHIGD